ncbi:MAG: DUF4143 domain-containing protein [Candidatus Methanoplasma sp.]|jgi:predicted AAA+ superfamily ATPase|nr:DUF4143 domain-containing protein [Candidatus Methanoplasma sp.]
MAIESEYRPRLADIQLKAELDAFGAVLIVGPKWCGKTTTAEHAAKSAIYMRDPEMRDRYASIAEMKPSNILNGDNPRLIDEWQSSPKLWDAVRHSVDMRGLTGLYILTGSAVVDETAMMHTGAGRISRMRMRTMSLYESGDSTGEVSLGSLFSRPGEIDGSSDLDLSDVARILVRGGWPASVGASEETAHKRVSGYCESIVRYGVSAIDGRRRDPDKARAVLRSLSRNTSSVASSAAILKGAAREGGSMHLNTLNDYVSALKRLYVADDLPAWSPRLRSKTTIRTSDKRHLADPAIAAYFLGASPGDLEMDPETFGLLFESMAVRDFRAYAQALGGDVYHYRDKYGLEADLVIHLHDGRWGAAEVKLGPGRIDEGASSLKRLRDKVDSEAMNAPSFLAVVTSGGFAYTRGDGVHVIPIGCLKD